MYRRGVTETMGREPLLGEAGAFTSGELEIFLDDGAYPEARERASALVDKKAVFGDRERRTAADVFVTGEQLNA